MDEKISFIIGVFMIAVGTYGVCGYIHLGYSFISFHVLIGVVLIYYGLRSASKPFETKEKVIETNI